MAKAIKIENLSKAYQLGDFGTGSISRDLERYWATVRGKEDPFLKIGEINDRATRGKSDIVWSLKDLNIEIEQGDAVGIIGRNGAGKSTLLKILSRVTSPTKGSIKVKGRIASLLEVGTGFHPELTGRENIFLNGAILGMRKAEIKRKFDEIVDFSGVERYVNTPVKRYSSGMYVRLAFAVAAHLESEILIVDEVLAVGDAEFQKKCLGKMGEVSKGEGRTILFVSHNMDSVRSLCNKGIVLNNGCIMFDGYVNEAVNMYSQRSSHEEIKTRISDLQLTEDIRIECFEIDSPLIESHENIKFKLSLFSLVINHITSIAIFLYNDQEEKVAFFDLRSKDLTLKSISSQQVEIKGILKNLPLLPGQYNLGIHIQSNLLYNDFFNLINFKVSQKPLTDDNLPYPISVRGKTEIDYEFIIS